MRSKNENQRTEEWKAERRGMPTASKYSILMAPRGLGVGAQTYARQLVADSLQDEFEEVYVNLDMQNGIDREPLAIAKYEKEYFVTVEDAGFIKRKLNLLDENGEIDLKYNILFGASPDGLIGTQGGIEVKCPKADQHTLNLLEDECPSQYIDQIQGCMFVTGRKWWDFVSYNPNFKKEYQMKVIRVKADEAWQEKFKERLIQLYGIMDELKEKLGL
jgi:hypothetical protein